MDILVAYYSRTGNTEKLARKIAVQLDADIDKVIDLKKRSGIIGLMGSGKDALLKKESQIEYKKDPGKYDMVIAGSPVWADRISPALRTYIISNELKNIGFFCTFGGSAGKIYENVKEISGNISVSLGLKEKNIENCAVEIDEFCGKIKTD